MFLRYSSSVVAPITCSSPRARDGFKMLAASIEPSADAPAPTMVCISSIKRMTSSAFSTSSMAFLMRSSKSPRYFVPATIPVRSSATSRLPLSNSGALPSAIFKASPSATAVLPTPRSPIRHGLFLVLRQSI